MQTNKCILLVEDNKPILENTIELLQLEGYEVIVASDGYQGLELVKSKRPDLILCDIMMPVIDGYTFLRTIRESDQLLTIPFIFFTAYSEKTQIDKGLKMGATDYLVKPFDPDDLITMIQKYLSQEASP